MTSKRRPRPRKLSLEKLGERVLFAADWQNADLPCDVDNSGIVAPLDVLVLINSINRDGDRELGTRSGSSDPYFDVDGDQHLTAVDVVRVINVINRAMPDLGVTSSLGNSIDTDNNGAVTAESALIQGKTGIGSTIRITVENEVSPLALVAPTVISANSEGDFSVSLPLVAGLNRVHMQIRDELGRTIERVGEIRRGDLISNWNASLANVIRRLGSGTVWTAEQSVAIKPPGAARNLAMLYTAMFDAVNAVQGTYQGFAVNLPVQSNANATAAAAAAAYRVASSIYTDSLSMDVWVATYAESLRDVPNDASRQLGIELGTTVANAVLQSRTNDGAFNFQDHIYSQDPGKWHLAPEDSEAILPDWGGVTPFVIPSKAAYLPSPPPELTSPEYAAALNQVEALGSATSSTRTADQTALARFWADGVASATPPGHWNQIAADYLATHNHSLLDKTRAMALLNLAMADAGIVCWEAKFQYELWRPVDAIHRADADANSATTADTSWAPLIKTPAFPSYTSGHSSFSGAASAVLTALFGSSVSFTSQRDTKGGWNLVAPAANAIADRAFASFDAAAEEAGMSRIYGGIHYSFDNTAGLASGKAIGTYVVGNVMKPK